MIIAGDLNIYTASGWKDKLSFTLGGPARIELDLSMVEEFDSAGLQILLLAQRECRRTGAVLQLKEPSEAVMSALQLCQLTPEFSLSPGQSGEEVS